MKSLLLLLACSLSFYLSIFIKNKNLNLNNFLEGLLVAAFCVGLYFVSELLNEGDLLATTKAFIDILGMKTFLKIK